MKKKNFCKRKKVKGSDRKIKHEIYCSYFQRDLIKCQYKKTVLIV